MFPFGSLHQDLSALDLSTTEKIVLIAAARTSSTTFYPYLTLFINQGTAKYIWCYNYNAFKSLVIFSPNLWIKPIKIGKNAYHMKLKNVNYLKNVSVLNHVEHVGI